MEALLPFASSIFANTVRLKLSEKNKHQFYEYLLIRRLQTLLPTLLKTETMPLAPEMYICYIKTCNEHSTFVEVIISCYDLAVTQNSYEFAIFGTLFNATF